VAIEIRVECTRSQDVAFAGCPRSVDYERVNCSTITYRSIFVKASYIAMVYIL
jgi:hypothetical protein